MELKTNQFTLPALLAGLAGLFALSLWGGFVEMSGKLVLGFAITGVTIVVFAVMTWWLLFSRLSETEKKVQPNRLSPGARQLLAFLSAGSALLLIMGVAWDEVWHRTYGVPLGEDFLWRPHILMYISFGLVTLFAFGGLVAINRNPGSFRQKFRAEPLLGLLVLFSGFMLVSLPMDPVWHQIYGIDLTAWSLPHLVMFGSAAVIFIIGAAIQASLLPKTGWDLRALVVVFSLAMSALMAIILLVVDWDIDAGDLEWMNVAFLSRPQWLFPALVVSTGLFFGILSQHLLKRVGASTLVGITMLATRWLMILILNGSDAGMTVRTQVMAVLPFVAVDVVYAMRAMPGVAAGVASAASLIGVSLLISQWYIFPEMDANLMLQIAVFGLLLCLIVAWYAHQIGRVLSLLGGNEEVTLAEVRPMLVRGAVSFAVMLALTAVFLVTATPPV